MSPEAIAHIEKSGVKEIGTNNLAVGEWFIIEKYLFLEWLSLVLSPILVINIRKRIIKSPTTIAGIIKQILYPFIG